MSQEQLCPQTFVEMVLALLEDRFLWLAITKEEQVSGADKINEPSRLHQTLIQRRSDTQSNKTKHSE